MNFIFYKIFQEQTRVSNGLDPDQHRRSVGVGSVVPNLGPNCLQKSSADDKYSSYIARKE